MRGRTRTAQRLIGKAMGFIDILSEANNPQHPWHDIMHALVIDARDFQTN
jgi:hypothetical protein